MSNELKNKSNLSVVVSQNELRALPRNQRIQLQNEYTKKVLELQTARAKKAIDREDMSGIIDALTEKTRNAMNYGANIEMTSKINHGNTETVVKISDPTSANSKNNIIAWAIGIIALIIIVYLLK